MTINTASVNPYINMQKQQSTQQQNSINLESLSFDEIKSIIPTEEKYPNFLEFKEEMLKLDKGSEYTAYIMSSNFTNNKNLNSAMYETLKNDTKAGQVLFMHEIEQNMADEYNNIDIEASFIMPTNQNEHIHSNNFLTQKEKKTIDFDNFISKMLTTFTEDLNEAKGGTLKQQYQNIVDRYSTLQRNYDQEKSEPIYA